MSEKQNQLLHPNSYSLVTALSAAVVLAALSIRFSPFAAPLPIYLEVARGLAAGGGLITNYTPAGYSLFLASAIRLAGLNGIFYGQAILYILTVLLAYYLIVRVTPIRGFALLGAMAVAVHPLLLLNIKRIIDHNLDVPALLAVTILMPATLRMRSTKPMAARLRVRSILPAIGCGLVFGYMAETRPNFDLLTMGFCLFLLWRRKFAEFAVLVGVATVIVVALSLSVAPTLQFPLPGYGAYGAYTFACGNNPTSMESLIHNADCETVEFGDFLTARLNIPTGLQTEPAMDQWRQGHAKDFYGLAFTFIMQHPVTFLELIGIKTFTFFRPDFRHVNDSSLLQGRKMSALQILLALPFPLWLIARLVVRKTIGWMNGLPTVPIAAIYIIPFLLTNGDPRFRLPLDILMIVDISTCLSIDVGAMHATPNLTTRQSQAPT
jgi:hypothetical protein